MKSRCLPSVLRPIPFFLCATALIAFAPLPAFVRTPPAVNPGKIPIGTVIPISLEHALSSKDLTKGELLEGSIMQDVPLPDREKIPGGSKILGSVLSVTSSEDGMASITFRLDGIETKHESYKVVTGLRTMAPFTDVQSAQLPRQAGSESASAQWATTVQIGGDFRYGAGGKVTNKHHRTIGKGTSDGGVLVQLQDPPGSPCANWPDNTGDEKRPQALWVFSGDACGLFDLKKMRIQHAGNKEPFGEITLAKEDGNIKIMKSSGMLLRVVK